MRKPGKRFLIMPGFLSARFVRGMQLRWLRPNRAAPARDSDAVARTSAPRPRALPDELQRSGFPFAGAALMLWRMNRLWPSGRRAWIFLIVTAGLLAAGVECFVRDLEARGRAYSPQAQPPPPQERAETMAR